MRLDLLWWKHVRPPRPHVAEPQPYYVFDMSAAFLDLNESPFARMLAGQWVTRDVETEVGQYFIHEGKWRKAHKVERIEPQDWFAPDQWRVQIVPSSTFGTSQGSVKIAWLEDELFPRLATVEATDNRTFRKGDVVQIVRGA